MAIFHSYVSHYQRVTEFIIGLMVYVDGLPHHSHLGPIYHIDFLVESYIWRAPTVGRVDDSLGGDRSRSDRCSLIPDAQLISCELESSVRGSSWLMVFHMDTQ